MLFSKIAIEYLEYVRVKYKPQTYRAFNNILKNYLVPYFGDKKLKSIHEIDYLIFQKQIENKNFSFSYKKNIHACMSEFLNYCIDFGYLTKNIAKLVGNFKNNYEVQKNSDFFTYEEFKKFIKCADDLIYKSLFEFLFFSGCRIGEALALTFKDFIDEEIIYINKTISKEFYDGKRIINLPKTKKSIRKIMIDNELKNNIKFLREHYHKIYNYVNDDFYIFGGIKPLSNTTVTRKKNNYCKTAGLKQIRLQDFRHSHATLLVSNNLPINAISQRLGHSNTNTTLSVYTHFVKNDEKRVINTLNSIRQI